MYLKIIIIDRTYTCPNFIKINEGNSHEMFEEATSIIHISDIVSVYGCLFPKFFFYSFPRYTPQCFLCFSAHILFLRKFNKLSRLISIDWKCLMDHIVTTRLLSVGYHQRLDFAENFAINRVSVTKTNEVRKFGYK